MKKSAMNHSALDGGAVARIEEAREKAAHYLVTIRTEAERLLRTAQAANEGYFDFDIGGMRYAGPQAQNLIAEGRRRATVHYFDAMVYQYFCVAASVEEFQAKLPDLKTEAMNTFQGDDEPLNRRKLEWSARARGRLALHSSMAEQSHVTFWRDLEMQFRALNCPDLAAVLNNGWWSIAGLPSDHSQQEILVKRFDSLVGRALGVLGFTDTTVLFAVWSDHLQKNSPHSVGWCINNLCAASAEVCLGWVDGTHTKSAKSQMSGVAWNIDRLRKECGWSFQKLARRTGIDKTSVLAHVNDGRRPRPATLRTYSEAFTKELQREITVADLEA